VRANEDFMNYVKKGEVLTLTDRSAEALKFSDGTVDSQENLLKILKISNAAVETLSINWAENFVRLVTEPTVSSTLMTIGTLAMIIEFQIPGFGLPGIISIAAFGLFFFGKSIVHLAGWEEVILFIFGVLLLATELILVPGKLIPGVLGILFIFISLFLAGVSSKVPFDFSFPEIQLHIFNLSITFLLTVVGMILTYWWISKHPLRSPLILNTEQDKAAGYSSHDDAKHLIGKLGFTTSALRPSGKAKIESAILEVVTEGDFIESDAEIVVIAVDGSKVIVRKV
jgi:membrane-bound serine protease (ClpP class)